MLSNSLLTKYQITVLYFGFFVLYISGMFIPLMENDSAQHASMAMRMTLNNDFLHLYKGENPYLDKPHLHFWLSALFMKLFGINAFVYRIPAVLLLFFGAFSTFKLANILYKNKQIAHVSALIFLSAQTIILSAHDVRTDAVLTGFVIFSIWQWIAFIKKQKFSAIFLAGFSLAMAFSSKGLMAIVIVGACVLSYLMYSRDWKRFFNIKLLLGILSFIIGILPILFAYYIQFGEEGIRFILMNQSVNRLTGTGFEDNNSDYFFFFHTLLWAFLPFSLLFYFGVFEKTKFFVVTKFKKIVRKEFLTLGGFWMVLLIFSFSKFKLPHYLNGLIPILAILAASYLFQIFQNKDLKKIKILYVIQLVVIFATIPGIILLLIYFTGIYSLFFFVISLILYVVLIYLIIKKSPLFQKYTFISLLFAIAVNLFLNTQFYPVLTQYQGSMKLAEFVNTKNIDKEKIKMLEGDESWDFDFYTKRNTPRISENHLVKGDLLIIEGEQIINLKKNYKIIKVENNFGITRLSLKFLNPKTRMGQLDKMYLIQIL